MERRWSCRCTSHATRFSGVWKRARAISSRRSAAWERRRSSPRRSVRAASSPGPIPTWRFKGRFRASLITQPVRAASEHRGSTCDPQPGSRSAWVSCRTSYGRRTSVRGEHGVHVKDRARAGEQSGRLARNRQGLGQDQRRSRARRYPYPAASPNPTTSQRTVSLRQRPQVQALLWTMRHPARGVRQASFRARSAGGPSARPPILSGR
jgi:hypothetical protein